MNIEKYTERARGFIQSAQSLAVRDGHQQFSPLHVLKVLLDDSEGLAGGLIDRAGGNSRAILKATEDTLNKLPKVSGRGAARFISRPNWRVRSTPRKRLLGRRATVLLPSSACCWGWRGRRTARPAVSCAKAASRRKISMPRSNPCARAAPRIPRRLRTPMTR